MADAIVWFDPSQPTGQKFTSPAVRAELASLAAAFIAPGSVGSTELAPGGVNNQALAAGAVTSDKIAANGVTNPNLADLSVTSRVLANGAVTLTQAGIGVLTVVNSSGDPINLQVQVVTAAQFAAITSPNPNVAYFITP